MASPRCFDDLSSKHISARAVCSYHGLQVLPASGLVGQWIFDLAGGGLHIDALGPEAERRFREAAQQACMKQMPKGRSTGGNEDCSRVEPEEWTIVRGRGAWLVQRPIPRVA
jgi:hypothetical protein